MFLWMVRRFGFRQLVRKPEYSAGFAEAIKFAGWKVTPEQVVAFSRFVMVSLFVLMLPLVFVSFQLWLMLGFASPFMAAHLVTERPKVEAATLRNRALGHSPGIVVLLSALLRQGANLEHAVAFAGKHAEGRIAKELQKLSWRSMTTGESVKDGLSGLADDWGRFFFPFKRSVYMLISSVSEKLQENRLARLERATDTVISGMASRMRSYVKSLKTPNLLLFSIGTVLPLVVVSMLPVVSVLGMIYQYMEIFALLLLSVLGLYAYSNHILSRRAASFSDIEIGDAPGLPEEGMIRVRGRDVPALPYAAAVFLAVSFPGFMHALGFMPAASYLALFIVAGVVAASSLYLYGTSYPKVRLCGEAKDVEDNIIDGLYHMASKMSEGRSAEDSLAWAVRSMSGGPAKRILADALRRITERQMTFEEAFEHSMRNVYSKRVRSLVATMTTGLKRGIKVASQSLFSVLEHVNDLRDTEEDLRTELSQVFGMMRLTAIIFSPLVCGLVLTLTSVVQESFSGMELLIFEPFRMPQAVLCVALGLYVVALAYTLTRHTCLINNSSSVTLKQEIARAIPLSFGVFVATAALSAALL